MNRLQQRRIALGLTQPEVVAKLREVDPRIDVPMLSRFERDVCRPTPDVLFALTEALQADETELYGEEGQGDVVLLELSCDTKLIGAVIPFGEENAITREGLAAKLGVSDREARRLVEKARGEGLFIINEGDGRGYYQTEDLDKIQIQYRQDTSRAMSILQRRKHARRVLKKAGRRV